MIQYLSFTIFNLISFFLPNLLLDLSLVQKANILSTISSYNLSLLSFFYTIAYYFSYDLNDFSNQIIIYFDCYLISELFLGSLFFPSKIDILSGYIHHCIYIIINHLAFVYPESGKIYTLFFICEIPTFILSLGKVNKELRNDQLFGSSFFLTRIVYHSFLMLIFYENHLIFYIGLIALCQHLFWFKNWFIKYSGFSFSQLTKSFTIEK